LLKTSIYIQIVIRWASIHRLSICIIDLPTTDKRYNGYSEREREVVVRECQRERMSFKLDYAGVYGYG
jgi:hypothetical protein